MKKWRSRLCKLTAAFLAVLSITAFAQTNPETTDVGDPDLPFWTEDSLTTMSIKNYVADVTDESSENFIPVKDRIAVFDFDGTLYGELYPTYFDTTMLQTS